MANTTGMGAAYCPFYVKEAEKSVTCEGLVPKTLTAMKFGTEEERRAYEEVACFSEEYARLCPMAHMLTRLYDSEGHRKPLKVETLAAKAVRPAGRRKRIVRRVPIGKDV